MSWLDVKYGLVKGLIQHAEIVTDLLACEDYATVLNKKATIILVSNYGHLSTSESRLKKAEEKLKSLGFKVEYYSNIEMALLFIGNIQAFVLPNR